MSRKPPRFGVWAPYRGQWIADRQKEKVEARFAFSKQVVLSAERAGFDTVLFAQSVLASDAFIQQAECYVWSVRRAS